MKSVNITWGPLLCECDQCVCQTQIAIREQGTPTWTIPSSPTNPTQNTSYPVLVDVNIYYQVRLTFIGPRCQHKEVFLTLFFPQNNCCPSGYTLSPDATYCYKVEDINATPPSGAVENMIARAFSSYSSYGTYIYNTGYNINGTGTSTKIPTSNPFWINPTSNFVNGPLNRAGVWSATTLDNQDVGFGICLDVPETKIYYVGIASDNYATIKIDNIIIVQQDITALGTQYATDAQVAFKIWHVYPVLLTQGPHLITLQAHNVTSNAAIGCELYNASPSDLIAATSYTDLGSRLLFSSKDYVGAPVQLGTGDVGYTCPTGYDLAPCTTPIKCRKITKTGLITC